MQSATVAISSVVFRHALSSACQTAIMALGSAISTSVMSLAEIVVAVGSVDLVVGELDR